MNEALLSRIFRGCDVYAAKNAIVYCSKPIGYYLELACTKNSIEIVRFLLTHELDGELLDLDHDGSHIYLRRSLLFAARNGYAEIVRLLLTKSDVIIYNEDDCIQVACSYAVRHKFSEVIRHIAAENVVINRAHLYAVNALEDKDEGMVHAILPLLSRHQLRLVFNSACYRGQKDIVVYMMTHRVYKAAINTVCLPEVYLLAINLGDRDLFELARRNAVTQPTWLQVRSLLIRAATIDQPDILPVLLGEMGSFSTITLSSTFMAVARYGSTKSLSELVSNTRSRHFIKHDSPVFMTAAKNGHASVIDMIMSCEGADNCDLAMYKKSGIYKAFKWATKNSVTHLLDILALSDTLWRYSSDVTLLNIQERVLKNEREKLAPYVTLALCVPMFAMTQVIENLETEDTLRYHVAAKYGKRVYRLLHIVESASNILSRKKDHSVQATLDAIESCQKRRSLNVKRKRAESLKNNKAKRIHIDLT